MTDNLPAVLPNPTGTDEPFVQPRRQDPIYQALSELGVHKLLVNYSGSGDSGCIDDVEARNNEDVVIPFPDTPVSITLTHTNYDFGTGQYSTASKSVQTMPLKDAVEQWCYDLLEEHYPGWEINEGSSGAIVIDPENRAGRIDHTFLEPMSDSRSFQ
ncbi:MAG: DUF6878 family protein [Rhodomicrobium sp.]